MNASAVLDWGRRGKEGEVPICLNLCAVMKGEMGVGLVCPAWGLHIAPHPLLSLGELTWCHRMGVCKSCLWWVSQGLSHGLVEEGRQLPLGSRRSPLPLDSIPGHRAAGLDLVWRQQQCPESLLHHLRDSLGKYLGAAEWVKACAELFQL